MEDSTTINPSAPAPTTPLAAPKESIWPPILLAALLIAHFLFVMHFSEPAICEPDANGYWAQGTNLYQTGHTWFRQESDVQYVGMHWLLTDDGRFFSRYPPGLAVVIAGAYWIDGPRSAVWFDPLIATLTLLGLFLLCRKFMSNWASLAAVLLLAINPIFNLHAQYHYAHMAVMCLLVWGMLCLVRWARDGALRDIFLGGILLGAIPTIRYPEAIFALGAATYILWNLKGKSRPWAQLAAAAVGVAIPLLPLLIYDQFAFGAPWKTAYVLTNEQSGFGWNYFKEHFVGYIRSLNADGEGPLFVLGILGMAWMCFSKELRKFGVLLALIAVPSTLVYMFYYWGMGLTGGNGTNMRYLLPTFLCYAIGGVWFITELLKEKPAVLRGATFGLLLLFQFFWGGWYQLPEYNRISHQKNMLRLATEGVTKVAQKGDVVLADSQILQHLDFIHQWRLADDGLISGRGGFGGPRFMNNDRDPNEPSPQQSKKWKLFVGSSRVDLQACKLEYSIVSPK